VSGQRARPSDWRRSYPAGPPRRTYRSTGR
jgi:hypothetical protein